MSQKNKLIERLLTVPKDFTYNEAKTLLFSLGYEEDTKGKSSGSRVAFIHSETKVIFQLHKPHPGNTMKVYAVKLLRDFLIRNEEIQ